MWLTLFFYTWKGLFLERVDWFEFFREIVLLEKSFY